MEELLGMSDRLIVLSRGRYAGSLTKPEFDQEKILAMASGVA
jgi:ribose transport system ATP-binding protein